MWRHLYDVNVIGVRQTVTAAVPHLRKTRGSVVTISSQAGVRPGGSSIPYAVSKAAVNHMTKLLAKTLGPDVRVDGADEAKVGMAGRGCSEAQEWWRARRAQKRSLKPSWLRAKPSEA
ncbi:SDR family NAD(P)-dependent oxidoreductase [Streptomyces sp. NPDC055103]